MKIECPESILDLRGQVISYIQENEFRDAIEILELIKDIDEDYF